MHPEDEALKLKAIELVGSGNISQAEQLLLDYIGRYPADVEALAWLAVCLPATAAIEVLDHLLTLQPQVPYLQAWRTHYALMLSPETTSPPNPVTSSPSPTDTSAPEPETIESATAAPTETEAALLPQPTTELAQPEAIPTASPYPYVAASPNGEDITDNGPVSLADLLPDFEPLPDGAVVIPPAPPPAPPQVEPLPLLDPSDWLNRANSETRRIPDFTQEATNQIFSLVDLLNKLSWLDPVRTADGTFLEEPGQRILYNQGLELARGGTHDSKKLIEAAQLFHQCRPPLGFAGAAEMLVGASYVNERLYSPLGLVYAIFWADRALGLDPFNLDALIARSEATVRSKWHLLADITVDRLRLLAPHHPRRYAIDGWYEFLAGNSHRATELLKQAVSTALTPTEKELCSWMLNLAQSPVLET